MQVTAFCESAAKIILASKKTQVGALHQEKLLLSQDS